ncbi:FCD domain-containing protein [Pengzhenrongella sp.]|jgi:DNA-binding FadR family transcriptional regulator|uniref:FCD domain-containing protein n=1 Tax=Pengzhenrongella sp. TaxID=2888820 RepID=UPI002F947058
MSLAPGDRLPDTGVLAESLSIGEITVRRTLETMCQDGLLERRRGRTGGTFVAANWDSMVAEFHDEGHARPLAELHLLLEAGLVAIGCGDDRSDEVRVLGELVLELDGTVDARAAASLEARFHLELAQQLGTAAAAERAAELLGRLCWLRPGPDLDTLRRLNETHRALLAALGSGSVEAAVAAVTEHASRSGLH